VNERIEALQKEVCRRFGVAWLEAPGDLKVGIARTMREGALPLNGLRHPPEADTTGWYLWSGGELSDAPDFFEPLHVKHLTERCPRVVPFLGLPPGWRFLLAEEYEDVWEDISLLDRRLP
jgi:hypothetical protein